MTERLSINFPRRPERMDRNRCRPLFIAQFVLPWHHEEDLRVPNVFCPCVETSIFHIYYYSTTTHAAGSRRLTPSALTRPCPSHDSKIEDLSFLSLESPPSLSDPSGGGIHGRTQQANGGGSLEAQAAPKSYNNLELARQQPSDRVQALNSQWRGQL